MKPVSSLKFKRDNKTLYSVHFDDGITIVIEQQDESFDYQYMLSTGIGSYYLTRGKWPTGKNLQNRIQASQDYVKRNIKNNRYKNK